MKTVKENISTYTEPIIMVKCPYCDSYDMRKCGIATKTSIHVTGYKCMHCKKEIGWYKESYSEND